jgi:hypothetical protein
MLDFLSAFNLERRSRSCFDVSSLGMTSAYYRTIILMTQKSPNRAPNACFAQFREERLLLAEMRGGNKVV